ncbi:MAG: single-stranded DNA-binding protein [Bryobacteraceae bacterium]
MVGSRCRSFLSAQRKSGRKTKQLPNGSSITKFSDATTKPWKDEKGEWNNKTQWHNVIAFGQGFARLTSRLSKGTLVFVQGELATREYERTISVPVIQQLAVELKADTIRILDRSGNSDPSELTEAAAEDEVPLRGPQSPIGVRHGTLKL